MGRSAMRHSSRSERSCSDLHSLQFFGVGARYLEQSSSLVRRWNWQQNLQVEEWFSDRPVATVASPVSRFDFYCQLRQQLSLDLAQQITVRPGEVQTFPNLHIA